MKYMDDRASHHGGSQRLATLFLTSQCNLKCPYCYAIENEFLPEEDWDLASLQPLLDLLALRGYRIAIGGGEPLTRPSFMLDVAREASKRNMGICLLTNGCLLDESLLRDIRGAGIDWIQISADSAKDVEHFAHLLSEGAAIGIRMAIGTVLMPEHIGELKEMHRIMEEHHATGWRILRYTSLSKNPMATPTPTNQEWIQMLFTVEETLRPLTSSIQIRYEPSIVPLRWLKAQSAENTLDVCGGRNARRLFLYPNGEVFACGLPRRKGLRFANFKSDWQVFKDALHHVPENTRWFPDVKWNENAYCRDICRGGCLQMRDAQHCDPRCELERGFVPICCFQKLLLARGKHTTGEITYPSELFMCL